MTTPMPQNWHAIDGQSCLQELQCGEAGLSTAEVSRRLAATGPNRLELAAGRSNLLILWDQFSNVMLIMLLAVAAVSAGVAYVEQKFPKDAIAIVVIVALNGLLGYLQESRAQKALLALRQLGRRGCRCQAPVPLQTTHRLVAGPAATAQPAVADAAPSPEMKTE